MSNFTRGLIVLLIGSATWAILMYFGTKWIETHPLSSDQKFKVVDNYNGCSVVRYTPENSARDTYFLDCGQR